MNERRQSEDSRELRRLQMYVHALESCIAILAKKRQENFSGVLREMNVRRADLRRGEWVN